MKMRSVGKLIFIGMSLLYLNSCKDKCHIHYYKVYEGIVKFDTSSLESSQAKSSGTCSFNDVKMKYYLADHDQFGDIRNLTRVYYYYDNKDTFIIPINPGIERYHKPKSRKDLITSMIGKGNFGCIPKFRKNEDGDLFYFDSNTNSNKIIPLMLGDHKNINPTDSTISVLTYHEFEIAESDYSKLNNACKDSLFTLQGGIDSTNLYKMRILDKDDKFLFYVDNN
jgi:hypothetical protein